MCIFSEIAGLSHTIWLFQSEDNLVRFAHNWNVGGMKQVSLKATCFQYVIEIPRRLNYCWFGLKFMGSCPMAKLQKAGPVIRAIVLFELIYGRFVLLLVFSRHTDQWV